MDSNATDVNVETGRKSDSGHLFLKRHVVRLTIHIPDSLGASLKQEAKREDLSVSALTTKAVELYLRQKGKREAGMAILRLVAPDAVVSDACDELEKGRVDGRN